MANEIGLVRQFSLRKWGNRRKCLFSFWSVGNERDFLVDIRAVAKLVARKSKIYEMLKSDDFPKPLRIGAKAVRWRSSVIQAWIADLPDV